MCAVVEGERVKTAGSRCRSLLSGLLREAERLANSSASLNPVSALVAEPTEPDTSANGSIKSGHTRKEDTDRKGV